MNATFQGFPEEAVAFFADLARNNDRAWFEAHKQVYRQSVLEPARQLVDALGPRLAALLPGLRFDSRIDGRGSIFRLHRDVRFSRDKSPYKTNLGMIFWLECGQKKTESPSFYVGLYPEGALVVSGIRRFPRPTLASYRQAVASPGGGRKLGRLLQDLEHRGYQVGEPALARVPRGFDADHPNGDLLRRDGLQAKTDWIEPAVAASPDLLETCVRACSDMVPLNRWLATVTGGD